VGELDFTGLGLRVHLYFLVLVFDVLAELILLVPTVFKYLHSLFVLLLGLHPPVLGLGFLLLILRILPFVFGFFLL